VNTAIMIAVLNHDRSDIKTQKHDIFVRTAIMVAILINSAFYEDCDHDRSPQKYDCDHFMRATIIVAVLINKTL